MHLKIENSLENKLFKLVNMIKYLIVFILNNILYFKKMQEANNLNSAHVWDLTSKTRCQVISFSYFAFKKRIYNLIERNDFVVLLRNIMIMRLINFKILLSKNY